MQLMRSGEAVQIGFWREFGLCLAIALAARGSMIFTMSMSADDYLELNYFDGFDKAEFIRLAQEMRLFLFFTNHTLHLLGAHFPFVGVLWVVVFNAALVFVGLTAMRIWVPDAGSLAKIAGASLFFLFPYHTDYLSYFVAAPFMSLALIIGSLSLYACVRGKGFLFAALMGMAYATSGQVTLVYFFLVVLFEASIWAFKSTRDGFGSNTGFVESPRDWLVRLGVLFAGTMLYVVINKGLLWAADVPTGGRLLLSTPWSDVSGKVFLGAKQMHWFLFKGEVSLPVAVKFVQSLFFLALLLSGLTLFVRRFPRQLPRFLIWSALIAVVVLSMASVMAVVLPLAEPPLNHRTLSGLGVYWSGVFALTYAMTSGRLRVASLVIGVFLAFCYAVNANRQATDHARINERDRLVASRMVERLCQQPGFENVRTVVLAGSQYTFNLDRITTMSSGFAVSSLYRDWSDVAVLREVSGMPFVKPTDDDRLLAGKAAQGKPAWPLPGSVFVYGDIGVVVMPRECSGGP
jgi:hypothetical protein